LDEKAADRLRRAAPDLPDNVRLSRRAGRDLDDLPDADAARLLEDIARVARREFPSEVKPIAVLPGRPLQADAGRFRFLFFWNQNRVDVIAVFPKSSQRKLFRGMK
jgi:hypothetical protein